eukprot:SAG22_NODE_105_length_20045_cov_23.373308_14_plen_978_part_00
MPAPDNGDPVAKRIFVSEKDRDAHPSKAENQGTAFEEPAPEGRSCISSNTGSVANSSASVAVRSGLSEVAFTSFDACRRHRLGLPLTAMDSECLARETEVEAAARTKLRTEVAAPFFAAFPSGGSATVPSVAQAVANDTEIEMVRIGAVEALVAACLEARAALKPADGTATDAEPVEGAAATLDGSRWGVIQHAPDGQVTLRWLGGDRESDSRTTYMRAQLIAVVADLANLVPDEVVNAAAARRLLAAGLDKSALAVAAAAARSIVIAGGATAVGGSTGQTGRFQNILQWRIVRDLTDLLECTPLLQAMAAAEQAEAEAAATADESAHALTQVGTAALVDARVARHRRPTDTNEGIATAAAAATFHDDCSLSPGQEVLAHELAPHVLVSRRHRTAIEGMVQGGTVPCVCIRFVAQNHGTNRPRDGTTEDVQPWRCSNCKSPLSEERIALEETEKARCEREDAEASGGNPHADRLRGFGLSVEFILVVTAAFDCWTWPTWKVQRDIIRPLCIIGGRCRFAELPWVMSHVGPADVFISHTWKACWGTLVAAALDGAVAGRKIWVDIVAVRQFPGNEADLDFAGVIERSKAVLMVAQALPGVAGLEMTGWRPSGRRIYPGQAIPDEERPLVAATRVWCLAEVEAAMKHKNLVVLAGTAHRQTEANGRRSAYRFVADSAMLYRMQFLVDVENADASVATDKERILASIREQPGGTAAMDERIRSGLKTALELSMLGSVEASSAVAACLCGEPERLTRLTDAEKADALRGAAAGGQAVVVRGLLTAGAGTEAKDERGKTGWWLAIEKGHSEVVEVLAVTVNLEAGNKALLLTVINGQTEMVEVLLRARADVEAKSEYGTTALMRAIDGHVEVAALLLRAGADVDAKSEHGITALMKAADKGHAEATGLLLEAGASIEGKDSTGVTSLIKAAQKGHAEVVRLLVVTGASIEAKFNGSNALQWAERYKHHKVANVLREAENGNR